MLFSTNIFLFLFFPLFLFPYIAISFIFRKHTWIANSYLLAISLFFYLWGNGDYAALLAISVVTNFILGRWIDRLPYKKFALTLGIILNLLPLLYFKYSVFIAGQLHLSVTDLPKYLPVGISFFTFMAISYLVDIYRKKYHSVNLINFGTYLTLFPHIVAGPIVRYADVSAELKNRKLSLDHFYDGMTRFCFGLGKKVILANGLGLMADKVFVLPPNELSFTIAWIGAILYTLQIFYDFSGYTDMALGLALFFGFRFPENFNFPYRAVTLTQFWQRWHMTLRKWFVDYVYIPLGGSRAGESRTYLNIFIVFLLTGIWHGAAWTFIIWGIYNGIILIIERMIQLRFTLRVPAIFGNIITMIFVMIGWVFFRSDTIAQAVFRIQAMVGLYHPSAQYFTIFYFLDRRTLVFLIPAVFFALFSVEQLAQKFNLSRSSVYLGLKTVSAVMVLLYSIVILSKTQFTPFIYFQF